MAGIWATFLCCFPGCEGRWKLEILGFDFFFGKKLWNCWIVEGDRVLLEHLWRQLTAALQLPLSSVPLWLVCMECMKWWKQSKRRKCPGTPMSRSIPRCLARTRHWDEKLSLFAHHFDCKKCEVLSIEFSTSANVSVRLVSIFDFVEALGRGGTAGHGATETAADAAEASNGMRYAVCHENGDLSFTSRSTWIKVFLWLSDFRQKNIRQLWGESLTARLHEKALQQWNREWQEISKDGRGLIEKKKSNSKN